MNRMLLAVLLLVYPGIAMTQNAQGGATHPDDALYEANRRGWYESVEQRMQAARFTCGISLIGCTLLRRRQPINCHFPDRDPLFGYSDEGAGGRPQDSADSRKDSVGVPGTERQCQELRAKAEKGRVASRNDAKDKSLSIGAHAGRTLTAADCSLRRGHPGRGAQALAAYPLCTPRKPPATEGERAAPSGAALIVQQMREAYFSSTLSLL